ncbi:hypothetical protein BABINDRAFT_36833 [Babjeviella inositovora NRRL Y-12698]|uniref:WDR5-like beta-propeller domain-containing protein n=1 Tax=Babjeviella inositovora NRRL Y-12698 TaxID=984486 RepID=A0A1E3QQ85_9ASCO|nr:uncharacterized protein BABINDRAFT_36833 [Babjeviella inositovora NRRL Y-12698]ODQ79820.1 hypothetical protein BABINDRAFT_36833 [Babjeviella inositovora NRRL Y-12698]
MDTSSEKTPYGLRYSISVPSASIAKLSPDGHMFAVASADKLVRIYDARHGRLVRALVGHTRGVSDLCWAPDSAHLASCADDMTIRLWRVEHGTCLKVLRGHTYHVTCLLFNPRGNLLISGSADEAIRIWDIARGKCLKTLSAHSEAISSIDMSWDGTIIASSSYDGMIRLFDADLGQCLKTLIYDRGDSSFPASYVRFSPNGRYVLASTFDGCVRLWDYTHNKVAKTYRGLRPLFEKYNCGTRFVTLLMRPMVVSGAEDGQIHLWDMQSKVIVGLLNTGSSPVLEVDVWDQGTVLISCSLKGDVHVWDLVEGTK